jgi:hypothetical protein
MIIIFRVLHITSHSFCPTASILKLGVRNFSMQPVACIITSEETAPFRKLPTFRKELKCLHFQGGNYLYWRWGRRFILNISNHYETTRCHNSDDRNLNFHWGEKLTFHLGLFLPVSSLSVSYFTSLFLSLSLQIPSSPPYILTFHTKSWSKNLERGDN